MLEQILSTRARQIYLIAFLAMFGYVLWQRFSGRGIAAWIDRLQAQYVFSGHYYSGLTILMIAVPLLAISFAIGLFHDYLTGQGVFIGNENAADFSRPSSNRKIEYQLTTQKEVIDEVRSKFRAEIHQLRMLGFDEIGFYREIVPWFGVHVGLLGFLGALGMLSNEVTRMGPKLTVNGFFVLMASRKDAAYVSMTKLGVKFYTAFTDGTCLITANYQGIEFQDETHKLYRLALSAPLPSAWAAHKQKAIKFEAEGKRTCEDTSMAGYLSTITREDDYMLKHLSEFLTPAK